MLLASTTIEAADDLTSTYPYFVKISDTEYVFSKSQIYILVSAASNSTTTQYKFVSHLNRGAGDLTATLPLLSAARGYIMTNNADSIIVKWIDNQWIGNLTTGGYTMQSSASSGGGTVRYIDPIVYDVSSLKANHIVYYFKGGSSSNSSATTTVAISKSTITIPENDIEGIINDVLNSTTSSSTTANQIQQNATNAYTDYTSGTISLSQLQATISDLQQQLETLNSQSSNTLADKVAITNATLQVQLVQDAANKDEIIDELQTDLKVSSNIQSQITGKINEANQTFQNYSQGSVTQTQAVTQINQYITYLTSQITPETPTADIEAINAAINTINGIKDSITNHSELDQNVSEEQVRSDEEEIEMLNEMISVMQDQDIENKLQDQEITGNASDINTILEPVWNNDYFKFLIGCAGVLIIACIVLHVRYRFL